MHENHLHNSLRNDIDNSDILIMSDNCRPIYSFMGSPSFMGLPLLLSPIEMYCRIDHDVFHSRLDLEVEIAKAGGLGASSTERRWEISNNSKGREIGLRSHSEAVLISLVVCNGCSSE